MSTQFAIQLVISVDVLFYGAKKGGIALGLLGGIGLFMLVFLFVAELALLRFDVMLTIFGRGCGQRDFAGQRWFGCDVAVGRARFAQKSEIHQHLGAVYHLFPDHAVRYGARGVHDVADYLRHRDQKQYSS